MRTAHQSKSGLGQPVDAVPDLDLVTIQRQLRWSWVQSDCRAMGCGCINEQDCGCDQQLMDMMDPTAAVVQHRLQGSGDGETAHNVRFPTGEGLGSGPMVGIGTCRRR